MCDQLVQRRTFS